MPFLRRGSGVLREGCRSDGLIRAALTRNPTGNGQNPAELMAGFSFGG
jgi:hypothetical protein